MNKLAVGDSVVVYFLTDTVSVGKLLPIIRIKFSDDQDADGALQPVEASNWQDALAIIRARYPHAYIEPWPTVQPDVFQCGPGSTDGESVISTCFYASDAMVFRSENDPDRQEYEYEAGYIDWLCEIQETTKAR